VRTLTAILIVVLIATSSAFARKASQHHSKRAAPNHQSTNKADPGGVSHAIPPTSRSIERLEAFAGAVDTPLSRCHSRLGAVPDFARSLELGCCSSEGVSPVV
jgi:hypothetical protein